MDSNVFVYMFDEAVSEKRNAAEALVQRMTTSGAGGISFQVVR